MPGYVQVEHIDSRAPHRRMHTLLCVDAMGGQRSAQLSRAAVELYTAKADGDSHMTFVEYFEQYRIVKEITNLEGGVPGNKQDRLGNWVIDRGQLYAAQVLQAEQQPPDQREQVKRTLISFTDPHPGDTEAFAYAKLLQHVPFNSEADLLPVGTVSYLHRCLQLQLFGQGIVIEVGVEVSQLILPAAFCISGCCQQCDVMNAATYCCRACGMTSCNIALATSSTRPTSARCCSGCCMPSLS
jgi:hypothetical protein